LPPLLRYFLTLEVKGLAHVERLDEPAIYFYNYQGPYAPLLLLRALPERKRNRLAVSVNAYLWRGARRWQGYLASLTIAALPLNRDVANPRASLRQLGNMLAHGWSVAIPPEGEPERGGELRPFLGGAGFLAVRLGVPAVPTRIEGYHLIFPNENREPEMQRFPFLPDKRGGRVRLSFGPPLRFPPGTHHRAATEQMRSALFRAGATAPSGEEAE
jgi:1-acyl-sn-glycerol-3-phosphate acyltransferase